VGALIKRAHYPILENISRAGGLVFAPASFSREKAKLDAALKAQASAGLFFLSAIPQCDRQAKSTYDLTEFQSRNSWFT
jgi:hypothetical protein